MAINQHDDAKVKAILCQLNEVIDRCRQGKIKHAADRWLFDRKAEIARYMFELPESVLQESGRTARQTVFVWQLAVGARNLSALQGCMALLKADVEMWRWRLNPPVDSKGQYLLPEAA